MTLRKSLLEEEEDGSRGRKVVTTTGMATWDFLKDPRLGQSKWVYVLYLIFSNPQSLVYSKKFTQNIIDRNR